MFNQGNYQKWKKFQIPLNQIPQYHQGIFPNIPYYLNYCQPIQPQQHIKTIETIVISDSEKEDKPTSKRSVQVVQKGVNNKFTKSNQEPVVARTNSSQNENAQLDLDLLESQQKILEIEDIPIKRRQGMSGWMAVEKSIKKQAKRLRRFDHGYSRNYEEQKKNQLKIISDRNQRQQMQKEKKENLSEFQDSEIKVNES